MKQTYFSKYLLWCWFLLLSCSMFITSTCYSQSTHQDSTNEPYSPQNTFTVEVEEDLNFYGYDPDMFGTEINPNELHGNAAALRAFEERISKKQPRIVQFMPTHALPANYIQRTYYGTSRNHSVFYNPVFRNQPIQASNTL